MTWTEMRPRRSAVAAGLILAVLYAVVLADLWWPGRGEAPALSTLAPSSGETATQVLGLVVQFLLLWGLLMLARLVGHRRLGRAR